MEIPDPPSQHACATCMRPLEWMWSPSRGVWLPFVPGPEPHRCRKPGKARPPTDEYLAARAALGKTEERTDNEEQR